MRLALAWVAGALVVLLAYSNSFDNSLHFDDASVITNNIYIRSLSNAGRFFTDARTYSTVPSNAT